METTTHSDRFDWWQTSAALRFVTCSLMVFAVTAGSFLLAGVGHHDPGTAARAGARPTRPRSPRPIAAGHSTTTTTTTTTTEAPAAKYETFGQIFDELIARRHAPRTTTTTTTDAVGVS